LLRGRSSTNGWHGSEAWLGEQIRRYTAGMTTEPLPAALSVAQPITLTAIEADRIAAAIGAARTESTRRINAYT